MLYPQHLKDIKKQIQTQAQHIWILQAEKKHTPDPSSVIPAKKQNNNPKKREQ